MPDSITQSLTIPANREFSWKPSTVGVTGPWSLTGDDVPGLTLNTASGEFSGTPTTAGDYAFVIANEGGDVSASFILTIEDLAGGVSDISVPLDFDLDTGLVTRPGEKTAAVVFLGKFGDRLPVSVGFVRGGVLKDITPSKLKIGCKEFEPERLYSLNGDGTSISRVVSGDSWRTRAIIEFTRSELARLGTDYEGDFVSGVDVPAEIEIEVPETQNDVPDEWGGDGAVHADVTIIYSSGGSTTPLESFAFPLPGAGTYTVTVGWAADTAIYSFSGWPIVVVVSGTLGSLVIESISNGGPREATYNPSMHLRQGFNLDDYRIDGGTDLVIDLQSWISPRDATGAAGGTIVGDLTLTVAASGVGEYDVPVFRRTSQSFALRIERDLQPEVE